MKNTEEKTKMIVSKYLKQLGVRADLIGYKYLREAILLTLSDESVLRGISQKIYKSFADNYKTTGTSVERGIRHAIEIAMVEGDIEFIKEVFAGSISKNKGKPTNIQFIATVADYISLREELS